MLLQDYIASQIDDHATLTANDVNDDIIFNFWCEKSLDPELSLKLYDTCLRAWINFRQGLLLASHSSLHTDSLDDAEYRLGKLAVSCFYDDSDDINIADAAPGLMQSSDTWLDETKSTLKRHMMNYLHHSWIKSKC